MKIIAQLLLFTFILAAAAFGQQIASKGYASPDGGFSVQLPPGAESAGAGHLSAANTGMGEGEFHRWGAGKIVFEAGWIKYGTERSADKNLDTAGADVLFAEKQNGVAPLTDKPLPADAARGWRKGRELVFEANSTVSLYRIYAADDRLIRLRVITQNDSTLLQTAYIFLNSLKLGTREQLYAARVREITPAELPQTKPAQFFKPDAADMARGKVKTIVEEVEVARSNASPAATRYRKFEHTFDAGGALTRSISYDVEGLPDRLTVYGFVDGNRVSKSGYNAPQVPRAAQPGKTRDERFDTRVAEKYDPAKRVTERTFFDNDGVQFLRSIYAYRTGGVEISEYRKNGTPDSTISKLLDAKGNETESTTRYLGANPSELHYTYKYSLFDPQGNWTKREVSYERKEAGKIVSTSSYTEYRTIMYW
jgi:hypothetical protein